MKILFNDLHAHVKTIINFMCGQSVHVCICICCYGFLSPTVPVNVTLSFNDTNIFLETADVVYIEVTLVLKNATLETDLTFGVTPSNETGRQGVFCTKIMEVRFQGMLPYHNDIPIYI